MKICEQEATAIARKFVASEGLKVGDICRIKHFARDAYPETVRHSLDHGSWFVIFAYAGPPLTEEQKQMVCDPPLDEPTTILVNDKTGEASILMSL